MAGKLTKERQRAHALLDLLTDDKVFAVRTLLQEMVGPQCEPLALAQVEEEEITPEMSKALERARASLARGEGIPHDDILREFGLKE
jgi:hypothetical protein